MSASRTAVSSLTLEEVSALHTRMTSDNDGFDKNQAITTFIGRIDQTTHLISTLGPTNQLAYACLKYLIGLTNGAYDNSQITPDTMTCIRTFIKPFLGN